MPKGSSLGSMTVVVGLLPTAEQPDGKAHSFRPLMEMVRLPGTSRPLMAFERRQKGDVERFIDWPRAVADLGNPSSTSLGQRDGSKKEHQTPAATTSTKHDFALPIMS